MGLCSFYRWVDVIQDYFIVIVSEFLYIPWKHAQEQAMLRAEAKASNTTYCTPSITVSAAANAESVETSFLKDQVFTILIVLKFVF
jgi:DNA polymerase epsilon subunit 1